MEVAATKTLRSQLPPYLVVPLVFTDHNIPSYVNGTPSGITSWNLPSSSTKTPPLNDGSIHP